MSQATPFLIANIRTGVERDIEPWLLPEDAFPNLEDCYLFRGRIERRKGFSGLGRIGTQTSLEAVGTVIAPWATFTGTLLHPEISPGTVVITVGALIFTDQGKYGDQTSTLATSPASTNIGTINYITGAITLTFVPNLGGDTPVVATYMTPNNLPVMGLLTREIVSINKEQLIGFDTIKANTFSTAATAFVDASFYKTSGTAFSWTGTDSDFFWSDSYLGAFWVTNNVRGFQNNETATVPAQGDGIRWYDGTGWINFLPQINGTGPTFLMGARIIVNYRNRLMMLNTTEGSNYGNFNVFRQRARWSQNGTPFYATTPTGSSAGAQADAWRDDVAGKGGFIDAPTAEEIISAQFYKDTLIVFFERSTWQLRYTGNELLPFIWERINVELGAESTFSIVPFDSGMVAVGNYGIITCDSTGVKRIDQIIPDEVFEFHNGSDGPKRVYGIRDYTQQLVYWAFPDATLNPTFPNKVLVYNYLDGSYAFFNDSFTCFGTYQPFNDRTWAQMNLQWQQEHTAWDDGSNQSDYPFIVAGNQQGYVFNEINRGPIENDYSLSITGALAANPAVLTVPNHNLATGTIIQIGNINGFTVTIAAENDGTALAGTTSFTGFLANPPIVPGSITLIIGVNNYTDDSNGVLVGALGGTINYSSGVFTANFSALVANTAVTSNYTQGLNGGIFSVVNDGANQIQLEILDSSGNLVLVNSTGFSPRTSGGQIKVRNNFLIQTKRFNPYIKDGDQLRLQNVDFFLEANNDLQFTVTVFLDENDSTGVERDAVIPFSDFSGKVWIRTYFSVIGQFAQLELSFDDEQMFDQVISEADVTVHAMMLWMSRSGRLTYGSLF